MDDSRVIASGTNGSVPVDCLVVDDEPRLRQVLAHLMRVSGYQCLEAADGADAVDALERQPVALVLSDMRMPRMDGVELLRQIRTRWPDTAVIMITAVSDVETAVSCLSNGALDYLTKPFHLEEVRTRVQLALEKRRLRLQIHDHQMHLEARVAEQARRIEHLFLGGVQALAEALEVKDPYTRGHSIRVSQYATILAKSIGLEKEVVRQIELGGQLHDIGKIGVREAVLHKAGRLTHEEYLHVMTHPVVGWRILAPLLRDAPFALNVVRSHHERYDGRGVPDGLKGEQIPLEARIVAVADALDAMTSGRPYRDSEFTRDEALAELQHSCGTQFDQRVVRALSVAMQRDDLTQLQKTTDPHVHVSL
jgi:response regulator RpfG family c-di-GMP phosphodiesterase